jgi:DNA-binding MarR family transcriptional regulator
MARRLKEQARDFQRVLSDLVKLYQFRDRNETVAYGISVSQAYALGALAEHGALTMSGLAGELHLSVSTMTRVVDQLVARALARRAPDSEDRRICRVSQTARGRALWRRLEDELIGIDEQVLRTLSASEREALIRALRLLSRATRAWRERVSAS